MAEQVKIPISTFELTVHYAKPVIQMLAARAPLVQALFDSFAEFQPNFDDLELVTTGKTSEQGIRFRIASQNISLFLGAMTCKFTKDGAVWSEADKILSILQTFLQIIEKVGGVVFGNKFSVLSLHLQPKTASFKDILRPFIADRLKQLDAAPLEAMAGILRWPVRKITLDGSAALANGIFVQMQREFELSISLDEMKRQIFNDEADMLKLLDVVEEVDA